MSEHSKLINIADTANLLGICTQTLRNWEKRSDFPFHIYPTLGGHRRYSEKEILDYLSNNSSTSMVEVGDSNE